MGQDALARGRRPGREPGECAGRVAAAGQFLGETARPMVVTFDDSERVAEQCGSLAGLAFTVQLPCSPLDDVAELVAVRRGRVARAKLAGEVQGRPEPPRAQGRVEPPLEV